MANYQILSFDLSAAQTETNWKRNLGPRTPSDRNVHGILTSGDTVVVQMTNENLVAERSIMETSVSTTNFATIVSATSSPFQVVYQGNYQWVRVVKSGGTGTARVLVDC